MNFRLIPLLMFIRLHLCLHDRVLHVALVDTTVRSTDPQAKVLIEKSGDNAYHKTPGKLHTLEEKVSESIAKSNK